MKGLKLNPKFLLLVLAVYFLANVVTTMFTTSGLVVHATSGFFSVLIASLALKKFSTLTAVSSGALAGFGVELLNMVLYRLPLFTISPFAAVMILAMAVIFGSAGALVAVLARKRISKNNGK